MSCVPGARVKSVDGPQAVKAEIEVRMGAMGMTFTGPVTIASTNAGTRTVTIKANTRETLGQSVRAAMPSPRHRSRWLRATRHSPQIARSTPP